jgi:hypothetical protein
MANEEHLKILNQGLEKWNAWRLEHPEVKPNLSYTDLTNANLNGADLRNVNLTEAALGYATLIYADLTNANLTCATLSRADLTSADLRHATLIAVDLTSATLNHTDFSCAIIGRTVFGYVDISETIGLESLTHRLPSTIGIDTIYKSKGKIPDVFLRKAGVPQDLITYLPSLMSKTVNYYACFISFTEKDDQFSERLYNDLLANGVRCWRWKEDAKWGKTLMKSIDEAVRAYDKLVVICSEQSLQSPAVLREIERALQKEDELKRQGKDDEVLFPVRLDDYIFANWQHHRKADVLSKNVGDFRNWTDPDAYGKCLNRLLRDLKPESSKS